MIKRNEPARQPTEPARQPPETPRQHKEPPRQQKEPARQPTEPARQHAEAAGQRGCALRELRLGGNARLSTADADALAKLGESAPERASGPLRLKLQIAG